MSILLVTSVLVILAALLPVRARSRVLETRIVAGAAGVLAGVPLGLLLVGDQAGLFNQPNGTPPRELVVLGVAGVIVALLATLASARLLTAGIVVACSLAVGVLACATVPLLAALVASTATFTLVAGVVVALVTATPRGAAAS